MEVQLSLKRNVSYEFSPQEIVDCSFDFDNNGCGGGWFGNVYDYAKLYAVASEKSYPYTSGSTRVNGTCNKTAQGKGLYKLKSYTLLPTLGNFTLMRSNIASKGPQAVAISVNSAFKKYKSGVISIADCPVNRLNHGVMLVGYDDCGNLKIQNSWGKSWGAGGFVWLNGTINGVKVCNIFAQPTYLPVF